MPEGIKTFCVMPAGMKFRFSHELNDQKNELDSDLYVKICGYHLYMHIWLIILFSTEKVKLSHLK